MIMFPNKTTLKEERFIDSYKSLGFVENDLIKHYKRWIYSWCLYASSISNKSRVLEIGPGGVSAVLRGAVARDAEAHAIDVRPRPKLHKKVKYYMAVEEFG